MNVKVKKLIAVLATVCMLFSAVPMSAMAVFDYAHNEAVSSDDYYDIISKTDWDIAPGITETEIVLNNAAGDRRQVVHMMVADISNPYTRVISSYTNMDTSNYAISTIPEHAAFIEKEWGENVVGAMNTCLSWYNSAAYAQDPSRVNEPLGFMMVDGEVYFDHSVGFPTCIVIHKDTNENGEARPADIPKVEMRTVTDTTSLNGWEDQVIPCSSGYIVKDGVNQAKAGHGTDTAARSVVGIKADGSVVIMMNDGRQAPFSTGMNMYECAEVMIAAGCVYAANCDGGGSSTFMSQRPGEDLKVNCSPCDGSLRQNTHGIMFISTAPATGEFSSAYLSTENDYYVPYSTVAVDVLGRDFSGAEAEVPADATLALEDTSFGTIENGVFTSNGKTGDVMIVMNYNGAVVGSKTIHIVNPETVAFAQSTTVIPYGKSIVLDIKATYGEFDVVYSADDFTWSVSDAAAGTRDGLKFVATNDTTKTGVVVTATYKYADLGSTTLNITFGKGSEILFNFEDGDISKWLGKDATVEWAKENKPDLPILDKDPFASNFSATTDSTTFLATSTNGKVKNGNYALGVNLDYTNSGSYGQWAYNMFFYLGGKTVLRDTANGMNATRLGMWIYIPEELAPGHNLAMQTEFYTGSSSTNYARKNTHLILECNGKTLTSCTEADIPEDRWVYCYMDLTPYNFVALQDIENFTAQRREPQFIRFYTKATEPFKGVLYIDDITLDYSNAVDDRNAPVISNLTVNVSGTALRSFNANVADYAASNASGLNNASAKIYVDGVALDGVTVSGNTMSAPDVAFAAGTHTVTFEIADNMGNVMKESTTFTVTGTAPVVFGGHNDLGNVPEYDSVYYADITVADMTAIDTLTADIQLNHANDWELDHMIVAKGFEASYTFDEYHNIATITVKKVGDVDATATTLVSIPVRVWSFDEEAAGMTKAEFDANSYPLVLIKATVKMGSVTYADGTKETFGGSINVATTMTTSVLPSAWHVHTEEAVADKAATCNETGYTGRTYCAVCGSVVVWGETVETLGHNWAINQDGKLACTNGGELFSGVYTDGKTYVDGVVIADGWNADNTSYYKDGVKLTGTQVIDKVVYVFDDNGVYQPDAIYEGFAESEDGVMYFYTNNNYEEKYAYIANTAYYFLDGIALDGVYTINGEACLFEAGKYVSCSTADVMDAGYQGDKVNYIIYADGRMVLGGSGATYTYTSRAQLPWVKFNKDIRSIVIGKDITELGQFALAETYYAGTITFEEGSKLERIGAAAFLSNYTVKEIVFPDSLKSIVQNAFKMCKALENVYMPYGLTYIHDRAFVNNSNVVMEKIHFHVYEGTYAETYAKNKNIPYSTREFVDKVIASGTCGAAATWELYESGKMVIGGSGAMDDYATQHAQPWADYRLKIKEVVIGKDITSVGQYAFGFAHTVNKVTFEEGSKLQNVGALAFYYSLYMTDIDLPETVTKIGNLAFGYCKVLDTVYIPQNTESIHAKAFYNSPKVTLEVAETSYGETYAVKNGIDYTTRPFVKEVLGSGTCGVNATWVLYSDGEMVIGGSGAMDNYATQHEQPWATLRLKIKNVVIGKDITSVGQYAFGFAHYVETVTFEEGSKLQSVGALAFYYSLYLADVDLPETVTSIGNMAFGYCKKLDTVYIPQGTESIHAKAFYNSPNVTLEVAESAYGHTYAVKNSIDFTTRPYVKSVLASGTCGEAATWTLYVDGEMVIGGSGAMDNYAKQSEQPWADYRAKIKHIVIGKDITSVGQYAFGFAHYVETVTFEEGSKLENIGALAFYYSLYMTEVEIPDSVKTVGNLAFGYCKKLATVSIPEGATVHAQAFKNTAYGA